MVSDMYFWLFGCILKPNTELAIKLAPLEKVSDLIHCHKRINVEQISS